MSRYTCNSKIITKIFIVKMTKYKNFLHTARKVCTVRPAGVKQPTHFTLLVEKISICTTGVSKESLRSHICHPRLRLGRQLSICDLRHSLLLLPRCIIYYFTIKIQSFLLYPFCQCRVNCHTSRRREWQTRDVGWPIFLLVVRILFYIQAENSIIAFLSRERSGI